ncbi:uncharacterized protein V1510DRAFT_440956 [Dipodascopsis tothii]|uniref:uncharacterized protein n=1 Tax=Dipodascopsis tothii TaxID=44089 RepID=UPI0034CDFA7F
MAFFECPAPLWDLDDLSVCARQRYLRVFLPLSVIAISSAILFSDTIAKWWGRYRGYIALDQDDDFNPLSAGPALLDEDPDAAAAALLNDDDDDDYQIYRLATTDARDMTVDDAERASLHKDTLEVDDYKVTIVDPRGSRFRVAVEETCLAIQVLSHLAAIVGILVYAPAREDWEHYGLRAIVGSLFWAYTLFLANMRLSRSSQFMPSYVWLHLFFLYAAAWCSALLSARSALLHPVSRLIDLSTYLDTALTTVLFIVTVTSPIGSKPIYLESRHGFPANREPKASIWSVMTFSWANTIIRKGYRNPLTLEEVWDLKEEDTARTVLKGFRRELKNATFLIGLIRYFKNQLIIGALWSVFHSIFTFMPSILVRRVLEYIERPDEVPRSMAWLYVFSILGCSVLNAMGDNQSLWNGRQICLRIKSIVIGELYAKALRRKAAAFVPAEEDAATKPDGTLAKKDEHEEADIGGIINLMAVDAFKVAELCAYLHYLTSGIVMIGFSFYLLHRTVGNSAYVGAAAFTCFLPMHFYFAYIFGQCQSDLMKTTDRRVLKTNELLNSIKIIKFFAWENRFHNIVSEAREEELRVLSRRYKLWSASSFMWSGAPMVITLATFGHYTTYATAELTTPIAFSALALFNLMRTPLDQLSEMFTYILQSRTSIERIQEFFNEVETAKYDQLRPAARTPSTPHIGFQNASFSWTTGKGNNEFKLRDLSIDFKVGELNLIVGSTGSGKTSLLMALLGEMTLLSGGVYLPGVTSFGGRVPVDRETGMAECVAYCAQQAWLVNDTVKNNILFGNEYDNERYESVVDACGLRRDFEILEGGDQTEVGERGIALSGGQKQRISLARALFSPARHLILDDCLSAVDSHTALWIYENCITGPMMEDRTCILVSHNVALALTAAAHVVVLEKGAVVIQGTAEEVVDSGILGEDELLKQSASMATSRAASRVASRSVSRSASMANLPKQVDIHAALGAVEAVGAGEPLGIEEIPVVAVQNAVTDAERRKNTTQKKPKEKMVAIETQATGNVKLSVYRMYLGALGNGWFWLLAISIFTIVQALAAGQSYWVRNWARGVTQNNESEEAAVFSTMLAGHLTASIRTVSSTVVTSLTTVADARASAREYIFAQVNAGHSNQFYLLVYAGLVAVYCSIIFFRGFVIFSGCIKASRQLFDNLLTKILRSKLRFFDATPIGRIMNRFSKDMETIDQETGPVLVVMMHSFYTVLVVVALIVLIIPVFIIAAVSIIILFIVIVNLFLSTNRELKRMEAVTRSPIYQHFGETLVGVTTIRAYGYEDQFLKQNELLIDDNNRPFWSVWATNRWMSFRINTVGSMVSFFAAVFVVLSVGKMDSGLAGLSLTYAVTFTDSMLWFVWLYAMNELNMNSLERVEEYTHLEEEPAEIVASNRPPEHWPEHGEIMVENLSLRYAPNLPKVINNVTFHVPPNNKIGIVGRTGAGKSTIASAFFRFLEAEEGRIVIDGLDISKLGLRDLRTALTIIPQDPTLFTGTIRTNLDPFDNYADEDVYRSLLRVNLIHRMPVSAAEEQALDVTERHKLRTNLFYNLESPVTEGGNNLSQGQRQLMCLARSLLKNPKVILLDEATASIDYATDMQIQETIREEFSQTTVITIAHRLRSIIDYDMILVLDAGRVKEYDKPHNLLQKEDSIFRSMCVNSGELEQLEELAAKAYTLQTTGERAEF